MEFKIVSNVGEEIVKVNRHVSVEQVINDFCEKSGNKGENFRLMYKKKTLDPALKLFYSGLEEGTVLELGEYENSEKPICVLLQVEHLCFSDRFSHTDSLWTTLVQLCPSDILDESPYPRLNISQKEIQGIENIKAIELNSLNDSNNRISMRLMTAKTKQSSNKMSSTQFGKRTNSEGRKERVKSANITSDFPDLSDSGITYLDERKSLIFMMPDKTEPTKELSDEFFELTPQEIKQLYQELKKSRLELEEKPLLTRSKREELEAAKLERKLRKYRFTILRICFPNRMILQGVFGSQETIGDVKRYIAGYLLNPGLKFELYFSPPRVVLGETKRLIDCDCVPSARIYFSSENSSVDNIIKEEFVQRAASYVEAATAVTVFTEKERQRRAADESKEEGVEPMDQSKPPETLRVPSQTSTSGAFKKTPKDQIPKWFRP